jgi:hypothetical protein
VPDEPLLEISAAGLSAATSRPSDRNDSDRRLETMPSRLRPQAWRSRTSPGPSYTSEGGRPSRGSCTQLLKNRAPFGQRASAPLSQARPCASSLTGPSLAPRPERGSFGPVWLLFSCWRQYL